MKTRNWSEEPISGEQLDAFYKKVKKMADKEFGVDDENDSSVEVVLIDRTRFESFPYEPNPYSHRDKTKQEWDHCERVAILNMSLACDRVKLLHSLKTYREQEETKVKPQ